MRDSSPPLRSKPTLGAIRRQRGLPPANRYGPVADDAVRCNEAGWRDLRNAVAHLVYAGRGFGAPIGQALAGPHWARERVRAFIDELNDDDLDAMADELVAEAVERGE